jgi:hypothetical protein
MSRFLSLILTPSVLLVAAGCATDSPPPTAAQSVQPRECQTSSHICRRTSPIETLTREDIRQRDVLPEQRPAQ